MQQPESTNNAPESRADQQEDGDILPRYLIFGLAGELYGSPLTIIKEVLKFGEIKEVPYMKSYFKGVINLRGQIISVVDLRDKFGLEIKDRNSGLMLVVESNGNQIAAIVDDVYSVTTIGESDIDRQPVLSTKVPVNFFLGVAKSAGRLVNLIDIGGTLNSEDFSTVKRVKEAA
jgi:purine-binding chemotaxis protein CheW